jgi:hypothetical protein
VMRRERFAAAAAAAAVQLPRERHQSRACSTCPVASAVGWGADWGSGGQANQCGVAAPGRPQ